MHVSVNVSGKKHEPDRGITHMGEQTILHGQLKDFRVNGASYRPCALEMTQITDQYIRMQSAHHPCRVNLPAFPIQIQTIQLLSREAFLFFWLLTTLNKLSPVASILQRGRRLSFFRGFLWKGAFAILTAMRTQIAPCLMLLVRWEAIYKLAI